MNIKNFFRHKKLVNFIRIILAAILVILAAILLYDIKNISLDTLLSHTPKNPYIAAIILLLLYAAKSITVFVPLIALQLIAGSMFSPFFALMINFIGIIICYTIPYLIGKKAGNSYSGALLEKYPKLERVIHKDGRGIFFPSFLLRCIGFLPGDLVSAYLGTFSKSYIKYILGSFLGSAVRIAAVTVLGNNLDNIGSPKAIVSIIIIAVLTIGSCFGYIFYQRKKEM